MSSAAPLTAAIVYFLTYLVIGLRLPRLRRDGVEIGFLEYLRVGAPLTLGTLALAWAWLALA